jgi:hypothetical protein
MRAGSLVKLHPEAIKRDPVYSEIGHKVFAVIAVRHPYVDLKCVGRTQRRSVILGASKSDIVIFRE